MMKMHKGTVSLLLSSHSCVTAAQSGMRHPIFNFINTVCLPPRLLFQIALLHPRGCSFRMTYTREPRAIVSQLRTQIIKACHLLVYIREVPTISETDIRQNSEAQETLQCMCCTT
jgi:hypothetical protein